MRHLFLILALTTLFCSCGTSVAEKSQKFIGMWHENSIPGTIQSIKTLSIRRSGENFIVRINDEKEFIGSYDSEHDKLIIADFGEIIIDPASKTLRLGGQKFIQIDNREHIPS